MTQKVASVNKTVNKTKNTYSGDSACLSCGKHLAYCGKPFSAEIKCPFCEALNVYQDSLQPKFLKVA